MMELAVQSMGDEHNALAERLRRFLRARGTSAKALGRQIDADPRTVENILNGHWPNARNWRGIVRAFGRDVLEAVFAPDIDAVAARLTEEETRLEEQLQAIRARRRAVAGLAPGAPEVRS